MADINKKLQIIAKNKGIDPKSDNLERKVTGLLYGKDLLGQSNKKKAAWLLPGGIIGHDFANDNPEIITDPEQIINMDPEVAKETPIKVTTSVAVNAMTSATTIYKSINVSDVTIASDKDIRLNGDDNIELTNVKIGGTQGATNGKVIFSTDEAKFDNISLEEEPAVYNVFEGSQDVNKPIYSVSLTDSTFDQISINHNILNIYTPADDALILVKNCEFVFNPTKSNALRISNITNAKNVTVTFEDVNWKNEGSTNYTYAGLVLFQAYGADKSYCNAEEPTDEYIKTWKFIFKNCTYNGEPVTENAFGTEKQVIYAYDTMEAGTNNPENLFDIEFK